MDKELKRKRLRKIRNVIGVLLLLLLIGIPVFANFRIKTEARLALREAKNVNIHLQMLSIEYYGRNKDVFDSSKKNGLADGVLDSIRDYMGNDCEVRINSYSKKEHRVLGFEYRRGNYEVIFSIDPEKGNVWDVNYLYNVYYYDGD